MTLSSDTVTFYFDDDLVRIPTQDAMEYLRQFDSFFVFVSFIHPITETLVEQQAVCYPKPQVSHGIGGFGGWSFITEVAGIVIRLPSDLAWFSSSHTKSQHVTQNVSFLNRGEIQSASLGVEFMSAIRTPGSLKERKASSSS